MEQTRDIMTIVGNNVKRYREEAGYSQSYLGVVLVRPAAGSR